MKAVKNLRILRIITSILVALILCPIARGKLIYVDNDATGANNGTNWTDAYVYLQDALADANDSNEPIEIQVARGVYKPDQGANQTPGDQEAAFRLINNVKLLGGYAGGGESDPNTRDIDLYETVLSGDLIGNDVEVVNLSDLPDEPNRADNSHNIVFSCGTDETAALDGFTITAANYGGYGGGFSCVDGSPTLCNCTFTGNDAWRGGGMSIERSSPTLINCRFVRNRASDGGGMYNIDMSRPILNNCTFTGNWAHRGGAIYNYYGNPTMVHCILSGNFAHDSGGALYLHYSSGNYTNCTFCENRAIHNGRAIFTMATSGPFLINCILWGSEGHQVDSRAIVSYSNISYLKYPEDNRVGNIHADPMFADPGYWDTNGTPNNSEDDLWIDGDYHLKSQAGRWDPNSESWIQDDVTSPCIDAGDPNSDWSGETWPHGGRINMGAYGGNREASMSLDTGEMTLPKVAYIYSYNNHVAGSFESLLESYGCSTTSIRLNDVQEISLDSYDLIIVAEDTQFEEATNDPNIVTVIEISGKPVVGLGNGGYELFGLLGLSIGNPFGGHGSKNSIKVVDSNSSLFSTPYPIEIPEDRVLQLYTDTNSIGIYLWPTIPDTITVFGNEVNDVGYFPLVMQHRQYLLWGFTESPQKMTEVGKTLFINVIIWTANKA